MEVFSPFIPINVEDSALPCTIIRLTVENVSGRELEASVIGRLENAVVFHNKDQGASGTRTTRTLRNDGRTYVVHGARPLADTERVAAPREKLVIADFEGEDWGDWTAEGRAFEAGPIKGTRPHQSPVTGFEGEQLVNSYYPDDDATGTLTSPPFTITRRYLNFLIGGGAHPTTAMHLLVNGEHVRAASGKNDEKLEWRSWYVEEYEGQEAIIQIVDQQAGGWGHINVDQIELDDTPRTGPGTTEFTKLHDFGTLVLAVDGAAPDSGALEEREGPIRDTWTTVLPSPAVALAPGAKHTFMFVLAWHMPNFPEGHYYLNRFNDAVEVARYVFENQDRLVSQTKRWRDAYYDSTLPYWLLTRLHAPVSTLATGTCQYWKNGRFWAWEGVACCAGTCTHVWNYAHAHARLFPQLARSARELQDFNPRENGGGFHEDTGLVGFRSDDNYAADGQCGTILKAYREHLMSPDNAFLGRNWPRIKKALEYSIGRDANDDGLIEDSQHNTFDINFFGPNTFVGSLYLAALRAGEEMAREMGDTAFADRCRRIFELGSQQSVERLWNGEYFIQDVDLEQHPTHQYAEGCLSDQVFGQGWAHLLDLGYIYPREKVEKALESIWKYNWAPDVGPQNRAHPPQRWFIDPGKAGLFVATWPKSAYLSNGVLYREEVWTGNEYQVAGHMLWEGKLLEALAICRAVHDRYHPLRFNPWNEVECGDHYARALASWGVYHALLGYKYNGPKRFLSLAPAFKAEDFKAAFTTAEGWGSFAQRKGDGTHEATIAVAWGRLKLRALELESDLGSGRISVAGRPVEASVLNKNGRTTIVFGAELTINQGERLEVLLA
jgi:non-lysosomal glucosylceramidase